jgi:NTP pyrophosphatase (non-canonical NTP hydrolase)
MNDNTKQILLILQEECAEVIQAISKCFRFGVDSEYNDQTNRQRLEQELGDLVCMIELLFEEGIVTELGLYESAERKMEKLRHWSTIVIKDKE